MTVSMVEDVEPPRQSTALPGAADKPGHGVAAAAATASLLAFLFFYSNGHTLAYKDSVSHLLIARRVLDSTSEGFAQLGSVWLPLPHVLSLPFIWIDSLYYSGIAATVISMAAYVVAAVLLYKTVLSLTKDVLAGLVASAVFLLNPNVLYMQSTPMTEVLLFACLMGMVHGVQRWIQTDEPKYLLGAGAASLLGTLTRYEAWILFLALTAVVLYVAWRKRGYEYAEGMTLAFVFTGGLGISAWLVWNLLIFGDPLNFQGGEYSRPSLWVGVDEPAIGDPWTAFRTYYYATVGNLGLPVAGLAVLGFLLLVAMKRVQLSTLPALSLLSLFPFFVVALLTGQRPLHVSQIGEGDLYNVRFGLLMVLPAAIMVGCLVSLLRGARRLRAAVACAAATAIAATAVWGLLAPGGTPTLAEPIAWKADYREASDEVSSYLAGAFAAESGSEDRSPSGGDDVGDVRRGTLLMESFGNEMVLFDAGLPLDVNVYEGSYRQWEAALQDPEGNGIRWIVMRRDAEPDKVYQALHGQPVLAESYTKVFENSDYFIYRERS